jgi:hypothetical protein
MLVEIADLRAEPWPIRTGTPQCCMLVLASVLSCPVKYLTKCLTVYIGRNSNLDFGKGSPKVVRGFRRYLVNAVSDVYYKKRNEYM